MPKRKSPLLEVLKRRNNRVLSLNHFSLCDEDIEWLAPVERLTLWNVKVAPGLLSHLEKLWWLDIRGGSATNLNVAKDVVRLEYLSVNQVRGMCDLSVVSEMTRLRYLQLYGLPKVAQVASLAPLIALEHVDLGQLRGIESLQGVLDAPNLRELVLIRKINVSPEDVDRIIKHPTIKYFNWFAEDVPIKVWEPVVNKISLPAVPYGSLGAMFGLDDERR